MGRKTNQQYASSAVADTRSVQLADVLRAKWKNVIKHKSPSERWTWLTGPEGITALGAKTAASMARQIERRHYEVSHSVCSPPWDVAWITLGELPPGLRFVGDDHVVTMSANDGRRYAVRLLRSVGLIRNGNNHAEGELPTAGPGTSRWTPPQAIAVEDELDLLSVKGADYYEFPASCSAEAIRRIGFMRGREKGDRKLVSPKSGKIYKITDPIPSGDRVVELSQGGGVRREEPGPGSPRESYTDDREVRVHGKELPRSSHSSRPR